MPSPGQNSLAAALAAAGITPTAEQSAALDANLAAQGVEVAAIKPHRSDVWTSIAQLSPGYVAMCLPRNANGVAWIAGDAGSPALPSVFQSMRETIPALADVPSAILAHVAAAYTATKTGRPARIGWGDTCPDSRRNAGRAAALAYEASLVRSPDAVVEPVVEPAVEPLAGAPRVADTTAGIEPAVEPVVMVEPERLAALAASKNAGRRPR